MPRKAAYVDRRLEALSKERGKKGLDVTGALLTIPPYGQDPVSNRPLIANAGCSYCLEIGEYQDFGLLKCTWCRRAFYCSRDCQKDDWPEHKAICNGWDREDYQVAKMAWRVHHNPDFTPLLEREVGQRYLVEFADAGHLDSRKVRLVDVHVFFLPTSYDDWPKYKEPVADRPMQGRFQLASIRTRRVPPAGTSASSLDSDKISRVWAAHRLAADHGGLQLYPLVLIQYRYKNQPIMLTSMVVTPDCLDALRDAGPRLTIFWEAKSVMEDLLPSGLRDVNKLIQNDDCDELGLVTWMTEFDKAICPALQMQSVEHQRYLFRI